MILLTQVKENSVFGRWVNGKNYFSLLTGNENTCAVVCGRDHGKQIDKAANPTHHFLSIRKRPEQRMHTKTKPY